jgi:hemolysin III-related protein
MTCPRLALGPPTQHCRLRGSAGVRPFARQCQPYRCQLHLWRHADLPLQRFHSLSRRSLAEMETRAKNLRSWRDLFFICASLGLVALRCGLGICVRGNTAEVLVRQPFKYLSTAVYIVMGWLVVIAAKPVLRHVPTPSVLVAGGLLYTFGVVFLPGSVCPTAHAVCHVFVLAGSICHYFAVLRSVTHVCG